MSSRRPEDVTKHTFSKTNKKEMPCNKHLITTIGYWGGVSHSKTLVCWNVASPGWWLGPLLHRVAPG